MTVTIRRRELLAALGGAAAWPRVARAQQAAMPVVVFLHPGASEVGARDVAAFRKGLQESGYFEGQNVTVEYHWLEGQYDRLPALIADLVRRPVTVIAIPGSGPATRSAKAVTATIPIVFGVAGDPVQLGLVASLARPGGMRRGLIFSPKRWQPSGCGSCMSWSPRLLVLPCWSIRPMRRQPRIHCGTFRKPPRSSDFNSGYSRPPQLVRSMLPLPRLRASVPMLSLSGPTDSSAAAVCNLRSWPPGRGYQPVIRSGAMSPPVG